MNDDLMNRRFNEQQLDMIRLLQTPVEQDDYLQLRQLTLKMLAKKLDKTVGDWEDENNITEETYEELSKMHFRSSKEHK